MGDETSRQADRKKRGWKPAEEKMKKTVMVEEIVGDVQSQEDFERMLEEFNNEVGIRQISFIKR